MADDRGVDILLEQQHRLMECIVVDAGLNAHLMHHVQGILCGNITGCAGGEGTAAQAAGRGFKLVDAQLHGGQGVGQSQAPGVVEMHDELVRSELGGERIHQVIGALGIGHAYRVGNGDFLAAQIQAELHHFRHQKDSPER